MFRFDHYFRTRNQSEINKRLGSIYKLIEKEKEKDNDIYGLEVKKRINMPIAIED